MKPNQDVKIKPGLTFDVIVKNSLSKLEPEDPKRAKEFENIFSNT